MQKITNDLLALAQNGDETAVAALIARMMPAIRTVSYTHLTLPTNSRV